MDVVSEVPQGFSTGSCLVFLRFGPLVNFFLDLGFVIFLGLGFLVFLDLDQKRAVILVRIFWF